MADDRVFKLSDFLQPAADEPIRSVVSQTADATVVAWHVAPGQRIAPHIHPHGQDSWTVLAGAGHYQVDAAGHTVPIASGDIVVAPTGQVHGVLNTGTVALVIVSVVAPGEAGYQPLPLQL